MDEIEWEETVKKARAGNKDAFIRLYEEIYKDLYRFAFYTLQNQQDAEDVISETVVDAFTGIKDLREAKAFRGWMFRICSNKCKRKMKEYIQHREFISYEDEEMDVREQRFGKDQMEQIQYRQDLKQALEKLDGEERMIITLTAVSGYTTKEVAKYLQKRHSTIRSKYHRGLKKLQRLLQHDVQNAKIG